MNQQKLLAISMVIGAVLLRMVPHLPNFAPITAMGLFGGAYLSKKYAILIPMAAMIISDYLLLYVNPYKTDLSQIHPISAMFHSTTLYVWGSFLISSLIGLGLRNHINLKFLFGASLIGSIQFFLITNLGVWAGGYYGPGFPGLMESYIQGLPFFQYTLLGDLFYTGVFFGSFAWAMKFSKNPKFLSAGTG